MKIPRKSASGWIESARGNHPTNNDIINDMTQTIENPTDLVDTLRGMAVGETKIFPAERANSVRSTASNYGFQWGRSFTTKTNRQDRVVIVTRTA